MAACSGWSTAIFVDGCRAHQWNFSSAPPLLARRLVGAFGSTAGALVASRSLDFAGVTAAIHATRLNIVEAGATIESSLVTGRPFTPAYDQVDRAS